MKRLILLMAVPMLAACATEEHEDIKLHAMSLDEALARIDSGIICSAAPIIALQWLDRHLSQFCDN